MLGPVAASLPAEGIILFFFAWCILETNFSSNIVTTTVVSAVALSVLQALPQERWPLVPSSASLGLELGSAT